MEPKLDLGETTELLHVLKSRQYVVSFLSGGEVKVFTADQNDVLLQTSLVRICRVAGVKIRPLDVAPPEDVINHPAAKTLIEKVGKTPTKRLFQYQFVPAGIRLMRRDADAEFYSIADAPATRPITVHVAHLYYAAYASRSGKIYDEVPGGARAYTLFKRGELKWPRDVYTFKSSHRIEVGIRVPIDHEQIRQVFSYLYSCQ
jgi:hypothetical protein